MPSLQPTSDAGHSGWACGSVPNCRLSPLTSRAAGTVGARLARRAAAATRRGTAAPSASTRIGRSTTTCAAKACRAPRPLPMGCRVLPMLPMLPRLLWALVCPRAPPVQASPAPRSLLARALQAPWTRRRTDPRTLLLDITLSTRRPSPGPPQTPRRLWSPTESLLLLLFQKKPRTNRNCTQREPLLRPEPPPLRLSGSLYHEASPIVGWLTLSLKKWGEFC